MSQQYHYTQPHFNDCSAIQTVRQVTVNLFAPSCTSRYKSKKRHGLSSRYQVAIQKLKVQDI